MALLFDKFRKHERTCEPIYIGEANKNLVKQTNKSFHDRDDRLRASRDIQTGSEVSDLRHVRRICD